LQGVQVYVVGEEKVDLVLAMQKLVEVGVQHLLMEGGGILSESMLRLKLVDEISIYLAPLIFGGENAPTFMSEPGWQPEEALQLHLVAVNRLGAGGI
jgi:2,5-diamino-6-(ribosylamino)-4(3H)-pyrimidinone 5'-phosphate reductase